MAKFLKRCVILTLILFVLGGVLLGVTIMHGGAMRVSEVVSQVSGGKIDFRWESWHDWGMTISENWRIHDIDDVSAFDKEHEVWKGNVSKTQINQDVVTELDIQIGGNYLKLMESEDAYYYIEQDGEGKLQAFDKQGVLYIKGITNSMNFGTENITSVILYVPKDTDLQAISVELGAGKIDASDLCAKEVNIKVGAGDVVWNGMMTEDLEIELGAGRLVSSNAALGSVELSLGAGDCSIQGAFRGDVDVNCAAGKVVLTHKGEENEFDYEMTCAAGSIKLNEKKISAVDSGHKIDNNASKTMNISVAAGSVEVEFE